MEHNHHENTMHLLIQYWQVKLAHIEAHAILYHRTQANAALRRRSLKKTLMFWVLTKKPSYKFGGIKNWLSNVPRHPSICRHRNYCLHYGHQCNSAHHARKDGRTQVGHCQVQWICDGEEKYKIMSIKGQWKSQEGITPIGNEHIVSLQAQVEALQVMHTKYSNPRPPPKVAAHGVAATLAWEDKAPKLTKSKVKTFKDGLSCITPIVQAWSGYWLTNTRILVIVFPNIDATFNTLTSTSSYRLQIDWSMSPNSLPCFNMLDKVVLVFVKVRNYRMTKANWIHWSKPPEVYFVNWHLQFQLSNFQHALC